MEKFKRVMMSIELNFTCVSEEYFYDNFREYYDFLTFELSESKTHGLYGKHFYKLKSPAAIVAMGLDMDFYRKLPCFICAYEIYEKE